jgi:hypothetical protein
VLAAKGKGQPGWMDSLAASVVKNLRLQLRNVHVRQSVPAQMWAQPTSRSRRRCGHRRVLLALRCQLSLTHQVRIIDETNVGRAYAFGLGIEHMFVHSTAADPGTHAEPGVTYKKAGTDRTPPASSP